jgi:uridine kinase
VTYDIATRWRTVPVAQFLDSLLPPRQRAAIAIVAIDGRSRSGKSTLAEQIAADVRGVSVIHTDDIAWHHSFFEWADTLISEVLEPLRQHGAPIAFTPTVWVERGRSGCIAVPEGTHTVLVEGVGASREELTPWLDASVWVETDPAVALRRTIALDRDPPGFVDDWMRAENAHLDSDKPWARATASVSGEHRLTADRRLHVRVREATEF